MLSLYENNFRKTNIYNGKGLMLGGTITKSIAEGSEVFVLTVAGHLPPLYEKKDYQILFCQNFLELLTIGHQKNELQGEYEMCYMN